ncbi:MAG: GTPase HflX [bacterium]|nr:GTPase HflX [bacterium]
MTNETEQIIPTAVLVGFTLRNKQDPRSRLADPLLELRLLVQSMGAEVTGEVFQNNMNLESRTLISAHLLGLAVNEVKRTHATLLCVDDNLTGSQRAHIEDEAGCEVLDRSEVILQIFAQRAQTSEGKLQVEHAQLTYLLPRLKGRGGKDLSALGGGIGTRGPGETQLETDRRVIRKRLSVLRKKIELIGQRRETQRKQRRQSRIPMIALVGYTNAGKSTLLNKLAGAGKPEAYTDNRLFATLDPLTRKTYAPTLGREILVTDTVGFIDRLPTELIAAFRATLEEAVFTDLLVIVIDGNEPDWERKLEVVEKTLKEIGAGDLPRLKVFSKCDLYPDAEISPDISGEITIDAGSMKTGLRVSGVTGEGLEGFWEEVGDRLK